MKGLGNNTWEGFMFRRVPGVLNAEVGETHGNQFQLVLVHCVYAVYAVGTAFVADGFVPGKWWFAMINESPTG
jgi:hypothetical protein